MTTVATSATREILLQARAECWPNWDPALVARAKQSALGRRMLANQLGQTLAPHLFWRFDPAALRQHANWLGVNNATLDRHVLDLGALLFAGAIRSTVLRQPLQVLRAAIGEDRYAMILRADLQGLDIQWQVRAKLMFNAAIKVPESLETLLRSEGAQELINVMAGLHPIVAERVQLEYPMVHAAGGSRISVALLQQHLPALLPDKV